MASVAPSLAPSFPAATAGIRAAKWTVAGTSANADESLIELRALDGFAAARTRLQAMAPQTGTGFVVAMDTVAAVFEAEEILYELREVTVALRAEPHAYLFDFVCRFGDRPECILPEQEDLTAATRCLRAYFQHLGAVCKRRGAALLDVPEATARERFDDERPIEAADLLQVPHGRITDHGLRGCIRLVLRYLAGDAGVRPASAELGRAQLWQWVQLPTGVLDEGAIIDAGLFDDRLGQVLDELRTAGDLEKGRLRKAARRLRSLTLAATLAARPDGEE